MRFSHQEIIEIAVGIEQKGYVFYSNAANDTKNEAARNILLFLAQEEKKHEEYFRNLYTQVQNEKSVFTDSLDEDAVKYLKSITESSVFLNKNGLADGKINTLEDVITVGKQVEKDSILFYNELSSYAPDDNAKEMLQSFAREEKSHLLQLQELEKLIVERGTYY